MTQEEKAKAYDEALKRAIKHHDKDGLTLEQYETIDIIFPELKESKESKDERIRKALISVLKSDFEKDTTIYDISVGNIIAWLEKQGEQKPTQEIEPFEAEHGKYYYCIKDYFCGGRKQASKGDVVQALRGLPIMGLKDASEYFLPVNSIKCNSAWSEADEKILVEIIVDIEVLKEQERIKYAKELYQEEIDWLKSLKQRIGG